MAPRKTKSETSPSDVCRCGHMRLLHGKASRASCLEWRCDCRGFRLRPPGDPLVEVFAAEAREAAAAVHEWIAEANAEALTADGFDEAIIGVAERCGQPTLVVYDAARCIEILARREGWDREQADEYFRFNTLGAWVGPNTPLFMWRRPA